MRLNFPWNRPAPDAAPDTAPEPAPAARTELVQIARPPVDHDLLGAHGLRKGMWVTVGGELAIITGTRSQGDVEVTLQKDDGSTRMELNEQDQAVPAMRLVHGSLLVRATIEQIPACRHPDVDHETHLRSFGYRSASETA